MPEMHSEAQKLSVVVPVIKSDWDLDDGTLKRQCDGMAEDAVHREGIPVTPIVLEEVAEEGKIDGLRLQSVYTDPETGVEVHIPERVMLRYGCYAIPKPGASGLHQ